MLARMIYSEQPGEGEKVMRAAAWVAINRVLSSKNEFASVNSLTQALSSGFYVRTQADINERIKNPVEAVEWNLAQQSAREVVEDYQINGTTHDPVNGATYFVVVQK
jgi:spore germination cell wall hydrolase CwlJ-like protein